MTLDRLTAPQPLKMLLEEQFKGKTFDWLWVHWEEGEGTWNTDLIVDGEPVFLCGIYTTDDWQIVEGLFDD